MNKTLINGRLQDTYRFLFNEEFEVKDAAIVRRLLFVWTINI